jgi:hypothetical protein
MTKEDVYSACESLKLEDMAWVRRKLQDLIYTTAGRLHQQRICLHPQDQREEIRRGDRSVDVVCRRCGGLVEYHGD